MNDLEIRFADETNLPPSYCTPSGVWHHTLKYVRWLEAQVEDRRSVLTKEVLRIVEEFDPECPDSGAYLDGHCSLFELVQRGYHERN